MKTREKQYQVLIEKLHKQGLASLGLMTNQAWDDDPKRLTFTFSRYKFVAKMLSGRKNALEVGCADAFASRIVQQEVCHLTVTDFDQVFVDDVNARKSETWPLICFQHDMLTGPVPGNFDGAYALDVLEHIQPSDEHVFMSHLVQSLTPHGVLIIGIPSLESQPYASKPSREGHVNCKTMPDLKALMEDYFHSVFMFSMNDEIVHTGYHKMANYLFAIGSHRKN